jgi:hypothetical protein
MISTTMNKTNNDKTTTNFFEPLQAAAHKTKRCIAETLSKNFNRLSPSARKAVLITAGLLIAVLCFKLVFAPADFNLSFGAIRTSITGKIQRGVIADSLELLKDSTIIHP